MAVDLLPVFQLLNLVGLAPASLREKKKKTNTSERVSRTKLHTPARAQTWGASAVDVTKGTWTPGPRTGPGGSEASPGTLVLSAVPSWAEALGSHG